ncbi:MAG: hypothetical protein K2F82_02340 [Muribaculaceae bacterium]|nr:hypothetical protein [Muribaculaceae bacterium]
MARRSRRDTGAASFWLSTIRNVIIFIIFLNESGLLCGLQKYSIDTARRKASIPKLQVFHSPEKWIGDSSRDQKQRRKKARPDWKPSGNFSNPKHRLLSATVA